MVTLKPPPNPDYGVEVDDGPKVETPTPNARQGVSGHNVRYVLGFGIAAVVVLFVIAYLAYFG